MNHPEEEPLHLWDERDMKVAISTNHSSTIIQYHLHPPTFNSFSSNYIFGLVLVMWRYNVCDAFSEVGYWYLRRSALCGAFPVEDMIILHMASCKMSTQVTVFFISVVNEKIIWTHLIEQIIVQKQNTCQLSLGHASWGRGFLSFIADVHIITSNTRSNGWMTG